MENKKLKKIIDDELASLVVTTRLKQQTFETIHSPKTSRYRHFFNVKLSLVSSFLVIFIVGLNLILPKNNEVPLSNSFSVPNSLENAESDFGPSEKTTTTTTTTSDEQVENE